jgi:predicted signal transduction protein with EAL and GGDEF domain
VIKRRIPSLVERTRTYRSDLATIHSSPVVFPSLDGNNLLSDLDTAFQPIVDLQGGVVMGAESLARSRTRKPFHDIGTLIEYASRRDLMTGLDLTLIGNALEADGPGDRGLKSQALNSRMECPDRGGRAPSPAPA